MYMRLEVGAAQRSRDIFYNYKYLSPEVRRGLKGLPEAPPLQKLSGTSSAQATEIIICLSRVIKT